jgi:hypothetical protein
VLSQMRSRAEAAGDVAVAQLALVAALRSRVVFCADGQADDVGSDKLDDFLRTVEAETGITHSRPTAPETGGDDQRGKADKPMSTQIATADSSDHAPAITQASNPSNTSSPFIPTQPPTASTKSCLPTPQHSTPAVPQSSMTTTDTTEEPGYIYHLRAHVLFLGIALFTHLGNAESTAKRLTRLHAILDAGLLENENESCFCGMRTAESLRRAVPTVDKLGAKEEEEVEDTCPCTRSFVLPVPLSGSTGAKDSLMVRTTHPRVMFELAFLVSSISRRDVVGRKPRRMVFAAEGLRAGEEMEVDVACEFHLGADDLS